MGKNWRTRTPRLARRNLRLGGAPYDARIFIAGRSKLILALTQPLNYYSHRLSGLVVEYAFRGASGH